MAKKTTTSGGAEHLPIAGMAGAPAQNTPAAYAPSPQEVKARPKAHADAMAIAKDRDKELTRRVERRTYGPYSAAPALMAPTPKRAEAVEAEMMGEEALQMGYAPYAPMPGEESPKKAAAKAKKAAAKKTKPTKASKASSKS